MTYLTDGVRLYELVAEQQLQNAGCFWRSGGRHAEVIKTTIIRDILNEEVHAIDQWDLARLREVLHKVKA